MDKLNMLEKCPYHYGCDERFRRLCDQIENQDRLNKERFETNKLALEVADKVLQTRLEFMNNIRAQLVEQAKTFANRVEVNLRMDHLSSGLDDVKVKRSKAEGEALAKAVIISAAVSVISMLIIHKLTGF